METSASSLQFYWAYATYFSGSALARPRKFIHVLGSLPQECLLRGTSGAGPARARRTPASPGLRAESRRSWDRVLWCVLTNPRRAPRKC
ncbi:MAG: hypothetical protein JWN03_4750 [Nocardia sp.]|nr:hypothetical protein [Nocardia sp.]